MYNSYKPRYYPHVINEIYGIWSDLITCLGFPGGLDVKESASSAGDLGLIPGLGRTPGEGNGNTLQYSCLENSMHRVFCGPQFMGLQRVRHD